MLLTLISWTKLHYAVKKNSNFSSAYYTSLCSCSRAERAGAFRNFYQ